LAAIDFFPDALLFFRLRQWPQMAASGGLPLRRGRLQGLRSTAERKPPVAEALQESYGGKGTPASFAAGGLGSAGSLVADTQLPWFSPVRK
jgi:hypothetical protein